MAKCVSAVVIMACVAAAACAGLGAASAEDETATSPGSPDADSTNRTIITSDSLQYDAEQRNAVFTGHVIVSDPQMTMRSDTLTVAFTEDHQVATITAKGSVVITQGEISGTGGEAVYHVTEGKIVLSSHPRVRRQRDELSGDIITFYRGTGRLLCEPNAVLKLHAIPGSENAGKSGGP